MQKALAVLLFLILCCFCGGGPFLYAQEKPPPGYDETLPDDNDNDNEDGDFADSDMDRFIPEKYTKGDKTITISLGAVFPAMFLNNGQLITHNITPPIGPVLSLAYSHFLGAHLFLGGEIGFISVFTLGQNALFMIPIGLRAGWQFVFNRFEIPLYAAIGIAPQKYLDLGYFGMYLKGTLSAYYRYNPNWSFGLTADWNWFPQWPLKDGQPIPEKNIDANIIGVTLSARYHF
jgi:hypothetical protein